MQESRKDEAFRGVIEALVDYLHRLANGEFPDKITEADIPEDLIPLVRTAALLGFQLEAREARREQVVRGARRETKRLEREIAALKAEIARRPERFELAIPARVRERILVFARTGVDVLLVGGSSDERSSVARMIHRESRRSRGELVSFFAGSPEANDVDKEIFGVERRRGRSRSLGALQRADGGTLFLDELSQLNLNSQARLVRFLKNRDLLPLGATRPVRVNVRLVLGMSEALAAAVQSARVRVDLARCLGDRVIEFVDASTDAEGGPAEASGVGNLAVARAETEVMVIRAALRQCAGNRAAAARLLGISREGFRQKVKRYAIVIEGLMK
ncbi:MAG: sigma 54-interacting transcriptional regulator [Deltaproteobacteria bacterium]|nr:sigma 54-interacting transcriptional regulator [Deltaproteobacteria bacterium]